jgi:hypothetical protein
MRDFKVTFVYVWHRRHVFSTKIIIIGRFLRQ